MIPSMKHRRFLVVSRFDESTDWLNRVGSQWRTILYDKSDIAVGNPPGREGHTYLDFIVNNYWRLSPKDEIVFCQANPFDHCPDFVERLNGTDWYFGHPMECPPNGMPHCDYALCDEYCKVFNLPPQETYYFSAGAQYRVKGSQILARPASVYEALLAVSKLEGPCAYTIERIWPLIFGHVGPL